MARKKYTWKIDPATLHDARQEQGRRGQAKRWADPKAHEAASEVMRERWQDPEYQEHMRETREEMSERLSAAAKAKWDKPGARERHGEKMAAAWTPERREAQAERMRRRVDNPEDRERLRQTVVNRWQQPGQREHMARAMEAVWSDPEYREARVAEARTPERREVSRVGARAKWDRMTPEQQQAEMQRLHATVSGGTHVNGFEARVAMILNDLELPYLFHKAIGMYVADFYLPHAKAAIECDGRYWHADKKEHDATRDAWLTANGYRVIRVPEDADEAVIRGLIEGIG